MADFHVHLRGGKIVPWQNVDSAMTTYDLQQHATDLAILPLATDDSMTTFEAKGKFANDDGVTVDTAGT
jgi:hypothetical protein